MSAVRLGILICEALQLDPDQVMRLSFDWRHDSVGSINVELSVPPSQGEALSSVLKEYALVEREPRA